MNFSRLNSFMNLSVRAGRLFGVPIFLHISLIFFLAPALRGASRLGFALEAEYAILIVLSILLHELGHALTAKHFGLTDLSITLHGFGGFAISHGRRTANQSLLISLAGPAVTFALALILLPIGTMGVKSAASGSAWMQFEILRTLGWLNLLMGFLNLIPSLPFDGGLALAAILSRRIPDFKAYRRVAHLGLAFTPILTIWGFATGRDYATYFGLIGFVSCLIHLLGTGGIRFGEAAADRRHAKEMEMVKRREAERSGAYLDEVNARLREREEQERLRKLLGE